MSFRPTSASLGARVSAAASATGVVSLVSLALTSVAFIVVSRYRGPDGYGMFATANMLIFVLSVCCESGLPLALARHIGHEEEAGRGEALRHLHTTALLLMAGLAMAAGCAVALLLPWIERRFQVSLGAAFALAAPAALVGAVTFDTAYGIYQGLLRPRPLLAISIAGPLAMIAYVTACRLGMPIPVWGAVTTSYTAAGLVSLALLWRHRLLGSPAPFASLQPLRQGLVATISFTCLTVFASWSDRYMVASQLGRESMGLYSAAVNLIQAALRAPTNISHLLVPVARRVAIEGGARSERYNHLVLEVFGLFAALLASFLVITAPLLLRLLLGDGFLPAAPALVLMTPSLLAAAVSMTSLSTLTGSDQSRYVTWLLATTLPLRLGLLCIGTQGWGLPGTALATSTSDIVLAAAAALLARRAGITVPVGVLWEPCLLAAASIGASLALQLCHVPVPLTLLPWLLCFTPAVLRTWQRIGVNSGR